MKGIKGDIWKVEADFICITTNGTIKSNGEAVMGRGVAYQAKQKMPILPKALGRSLKDIGNRVSYLGQHRIEGVEYGIISFPVKRNWWDKKANIDLIRRSAKQLVELIADFNESGETVNKIVLPRPGCGNGRLKWEDVKKVIAPILDDRFYVIEYQKE